MMSKTSEPGDDFDNATLRLCYARSTLSTLHILIDESKPIPVNPTLLADTLAGVELMIEDAYELLLKYRSSSKEEVNA